jgi:hypothetical protein
VLRNAPQFTRRGADWLFVDSFSEKKVPARA